MTENPTPTPSSELDFDDWLAGGERTTHYVSLYARMDIIADIERLEADRVEVKDVKEDDVAMGGDENPNAELDAEIAALYAQLDQSRREFRVTALTSKENEEITEAVRKDLGDQIDTAAAYGRDQAKKTAKRCGVTATNDINRLIATGGNEEASRVIGDEVYLRRIAAASKTLQRGDWIPLTIENVRSIHAKLGQAQTDMLAEAAVRASDSVPAVTVPK